MEGQIIAQKYKLIRVISKTEYTEVWEGVNLVDGQQLAVKLEPIQIQHPILAHQYKIYMHLHNGSQLTDRGIPNIQYHGKQDNYNALVMDFLGPSLQQQLTKCKGIFTIKTVLMIADQMLKRVEYLHKRDIIHRDIKPANFLLGKSHKHKLYLIDFGLSKKYRRQNKHISYAQGKRFVGSARNASINSHLGIQLSRRDDLQSCCYCLIYFLYGQLPWSGIKQPNRQVKLNKILSKKMEFRPQLLCKNLPIQFCNIFTYVRSLKFDEQPDYSRMKNELMNCCERLKIENDYIYDWDKIDAEKSSFQA